MCVCVCVCVCVYVYACMCVMTNGKRTEEISNDTVTNNHSVGEHSRTQIVLNLSKCTMLSKTIHIHSVYSERARAVWS